MAACLFSVALETEDLLSSKTSNVGNYVLSKYFHPGERNTSTMKEKSSLLAPVNSHPL